MIQVILRNNSAFSAVKICTWQTRECPVSGWQQWMRGWIDTALNANLRLILLPDLKISLISIEWTDQNACAAYLPQT
jgi:hypothetical protein